MDFRVTRCASAAFIIASVGFGCEEPPADSPAVAQEPTGVAEGQTETEDKPKSDTKAAAQGQASPLDTVQTVRGAVTILPNAFGGGDYWSEDSTEFLRCEDVAGGDACTVVPLKGKRKLLNTKGAIKRRRRKKNYKRVPPTWLHSEAIDLVWSDVGGDAKFGARMRGTEHTTWLILEQAGDDRSRSVEDVVMSPDGLHIAVLISTSVLAADDDYIDVQLLSSARVASEAYVAAGLAKHKTEDYKSSFALFHKARAVDPENWRPHYNIARAMILLEEDGAQAALEKALELGPRRIKKKLTRKDGDFAKVMEEPWFKNLVR